MLKEGYDFDIQNGFGVDIDRGVAVIRKHTAPHDKSLKTSKAFDKLKISGGSQRLRWRLKVAVFGYRASRFPKGKRTL
jgi:hypothetical protein